MGHYDALIAKWATLSGTTAGKLAAINALTVPGTPQLVPVWKVVTYLRENGLWLCIKASTAPGAQTAVDYNADQRVENIDVTLPATQAMLANLIENSLVSAEQAAAITAMAQTSLPWWSTPIDHGGGGLSSPVTEADLVNAGGLV